MPCVSKKIDFLEQYLQGDKVTLSHRALQHVGANSKDFEVKANQSMPCFLGRNITMSVAIQICLPSCAGV